MKKAFQEEQEDEWTRQAIDLYNEELDEAMEEMDRGEFYTHDEALTILKERNNAKF